MARRRRRGRNNDAAPAQTRNTASSGGPTRVTASEQGAPVPDAPELDALDREEAEEQFTPDEGGDLPLGASEQAVEPTAEATDLPEVHREAMDRYEQGWQKDRQNQRDAYDDLEFLGSDTGQWDQRALQERITQNRPILTVNKCPQFVRQVTGDIRQLRPSVHVVPIDERASETIAANVLPELVRYVERRSDAKAAYFHGADQMVAAGIGHCRVFTEYAGGSTFNVELKIGIVQDGLGVVWDPDAIEPTRKDAAYCFVPVDLNRKRAQTLWPNKSFDLALPHNKTPEAFDGWSSDEFVRVAEYWRKSPCERELAFYPDGKIIDLTDDAWASQVDVEEYPREEGEAEQQDKPTHEAANYREGDDVDRCANCSMFRAPNHCTKIQDPVRADMLCDFFDPFRPQLEQSAPPLGQMGGQQLGEQFAPLMNEPPPYGPGMPLAIGLAGMGKLHPNMGPKRLDAIAAGARIESRPSYYVERFIISAGEVLEGPQQWPGMHIPIVPFMGEEVQIGRRTVRRGLVRVLKDVQRLYNYAISANAETVALQPKAPFIGTRLNFQNFQDQWETANSKNWPYLEFEPDPLNNGASPQRSPPPVGSSGIKDLLAVGTADMSAVTGIYPASLGQAGPESSGKAITARQREGDTGTFHYIESFGRSVERVGQIVVDLIPHVYDSERTLRIVGDDGKMTKIDINKEISDPNGDGIATTVRNGVHG